MAAQPSDPLGSFTRRLGSHAGVYAGGHIGTFVLAIINVAVLTRLLSISEYGHLAVYLFFAALLTVLYSLGPLQGTLMLVFRASDIEDGDAAEVEVEEAEPVVSREKALTTGLLVAVAFGLVGTAIVFCAAPFLASLLGASDPTAVRLAALCGATGAVWRLVQNVMRFERRPISYSALGLVRPALALGIGIPIVASGYGVDGVLAGLALATALASVVGIVVTRRNYALGFDSAIVPKVLRGGAALIPIIAAMWIVHNVDLFLVSVYAPASAVAPYRVAARLGAGISYLVSAVTVAWLPLTRTPLYKAVSEEHGESGFGAIALTVFLLLCIWALLGLTLLADLLIRVAPGSYADAAPLVPLIGLGFVAFGVFMIVYRGTSFPNKRRYHFRLTALAAVLFLVAGLIFVPLFGGYGAAAAQIIAYATVAGIMLWQAQRSEAPLPIRYARLMRGIVLGFLCIAFGQFVSPLAGQGRFFIDLGILVAFPLLLVVAGAFPTEELRPFVDLSFLDFGRRRSAEILAKLEHLDPRDRQTVSILAPKGGSVAQAAQAIAAPEPEVLARFVSSLRALAPHEREGPSERDAAIATYLLAEGGVATRDGLGQQLCAAGADPLDLHALDSTLIRLRRIHRRKIMTRPKRAWSAANPGNRAARRQLLAAILAAAEPQLRGDGALLDCGCGTGWLLEALVEAGVDVSRLHGVDADPNRAAAAACRVPGSRAITAEAGDLPYPDSSFDAVFCIVSLSSFGSSSATRVALAETRRVLAPGGVLVIYEPRFPKSAQSAHPRAAPRRPEGCRYRDIRSQLADSAAAAGSPTRPFHACPVSTAFRGSAPTFLSSSAPSRRRRCQIAAHAVAGCYGREGQQLFGSPLDRVASQDDLAAPTRHAGSLPVVAQVAVELCVEVGLVAVGDDGPGQLLGQGRVVVGDHECFAGQRVEDPVGNGAVPAHLLPVIAEEDFAGRVEAGQLGVGDVFGHRLLGRQQVPAATVERGSMAALQRVPDDPPEFAPPVADEGHLVFRRRAGDGMEPPRVSELKQLGDRRSERAPQLPRVLSGSDENPVITVQLLARDLLGVAHEPDQVEPAWRRVAGPAPAQRHQHIEALARWPAGVGIDLQQHLMAALSEGPRQRAGQGRVAAVVGRLPVAAGDADAKGRRLGAGGQGRRQAPRARAGSTAAAPRSPARIQSNVVRPSASAPIATSARAASGTRSSPSFSVAAVTAGGHSGSTSTRAGRAHQAPPPASRSARMRCRKAGPQRRRSNATSSAEATSAAFLRARSSHAAIAPRR